MAQETRTGRTVNSVCLAVALAAAALWPGAAMAASTITGVVTFAGPAPTLKPITMEGTYTIPPFTGCGLLTPLLTLLLSGPYNTMKLDLI